MNLRIGLAICLSVVTNSTWGQAPPSSAYEPLSPFIAPSSESAGLEMSSPSALENAATYADEATVTFLPDEQGGPCANSEFSQTSPCSTCDSTCCQCFSRSSSTNTSCWNFTAEHILLRPRNVDFSLATFYSARFNDLQDEYSPGFRVGVGLSDQNSTLLGRWTRYRSEDRDRSDPFNTSLVSVVFDSLSYFPNSLNATATQATDFDTIDLLIETPFINLAGWQSSLLMGARYARLEQQIQLRSDSRNSSNGLIFFTTQTSGTTKASGAGPMAGFNFSRQLRPGLRYYNKADVSLLASRLTSTATGTFGNSNSISSATTHRFVPLLGYETGLSWTISNCTQVRLGYTIQSWRDVASIADSVNQPFARLQQRLDDVTFDGLVFGGTWYF